MAVLWLILWLYGGWFLTLLPLQSLFCTGLYGFVWLIVWNLFGGWTWWQLYGWPIQFISSKKNYPFFATSISRVPLEKMTLLQNKKMKQYLIRWKYFWLLDVLHQWSFDPSLLVVVPRSSHRLHGCHWALLPYHGSRAHKETKNKSEELCILCFT